MLTSAPRCSPRSTIVAFSECGANSTSTSSTVAAPEPDSEASNALRRPMMTPTFDWKRTLATFESLRIGRLPTSLPSSTATSVTSMTTPASRRAASPAPISKPSRPPPNSM